VPAAATTSAPREISRGKKNALLNDRQEQLDFIASIAPLAQASEKKYGVPASVTIAQAILESAWGKRAIGNNYFGIKARVGEAYCEFTTTEYNQTIKQKLQDKFRAFPSAQASFDAHGKLIANANRYKPAMAVAHDPLAFALQLQRCGYSTNPNYPKILVALIEQWKLTQYDADSKEAA
jgi:flagellum-specific peptidoglycan hydrolase FlgJ